MPALSPGRRAVPAVRGAELVDVEDLVNGRQVTAAVAPLREGVLLVEPGKIGPVLCLSVDEARMLVDELARAITELTRPTGEPRSRRTS